MRRNEEERLVNEADASMKSTTNTMNSSGGIGTTNSSGNLSNTQQDIMQSRIVALQNEIRQMREEGGVSLVVASRQAARAAEIATASMTMKMKRMERNKRAEETSP